MKKLVYKLLLGTIISTSVNFANSETLGETIINAANVSIEILGAETKVEALGQALKSTARNIFQGYIKNHHQLSNALHIAKKELASIENNPALEEIWAVRVANASEALSDLESTGKVLFNKLGVQTGLVDNIASTPAILDGLEIALDGKRFLDAAQSGDLEKANKLAKQTYVKGGVTVAFIVGGATFSVAAPAAVALGVGEYFNSKTDDLRDEHSEWAKNKLRQYNQHLTNANLERELNGSVLNISQNLEPNAFFNEDSVKAEIRSNITSTLDGYIEYIDNELNWFNQNRRTSGLYNTKEDVEITDFLKNQRDIIHGLKIAANGGCSHVGNCTTFKQYTNAFVSIAFNEIKNGYENNRVSEDLKDIKTQIEGSKIDVDSDLGDEKQGQETTTEENQNVEEDRERNKEIIEQRIRQSNQANQERKKREAEIRSTRSEQASLNTQRSELQEELNNKRNELTRLEFGEIERVQNELRSIGTELNDLRLRKNASISPNSALRRQQEKFSEDIRYLQGAINIRNNISTPSNVTRKQRNALNALARRLLVRGNGRQEAWQVLLLQANFLLNDRRNKLVDVNRRISQVEASGRFTSADDQRLKDLVRRQAELENYQSTISNKISNTRNEIASLETQLLSIGNQINFNNERLIALDTELDNTLYQIISPDDWLRDTSIITTALTDEEKVELTQNTQPELSPEQVPAPELTMPDADPIIVPPTADIPQTPTPNRLLNPTFGFVTGGDTNSDGNSNFFVVGVQEGSVNTDQGLDAVSLRFSDNRGRNQIVTVDARSQEDFEYLTWGQTEQPLNRFFPATQFNHTLRNSFWILGQETPVNNLSIRMGTATFSGDIYGHFIDSNLGANGNFYDAVTGDVQFVADFSDDSLSGQGVFRIDTPNLDTSESFTIQGSLSDSNSGSFRTVSSSRDTNANFGVSSSANVVSQIEGNNGQGYLLGSFYGPDAEEFGGAIGYFGSDGSTAITGVVTGQEQNGSIDPLPQPVPSSDEDNDFPFLGFIAGKIEGSASLFTGNLYTGRAGGGDDPLGSRGEARINRNGVNTFFSDNLEPSIQVRINESAAADGFRYSDWGEWNGSGITVNNFSGAPAERGFYVIGQSTNSDNIPRSGSAQYSGDVRAIAFSGENIGGSIDLTADFSQRNVNARLGLTRENGSQWVNIQTENISYDRSLGQNFEVNFAGSNSTVFDGSGNRISGAGANVRGMFVGPNAEEIIGDFAVGGVPDDVGGVDGVFRARQSGTHLIRSGRPADGGPGFGDGPIDLPDIGEVPF